MKDKAATAEVKGIIIRINKCRNLILEIKEGVVAIIEIVIIAAKLDTCQRNVRIQDNKDHLWEEVEEEEMMEEETPTESMMMKKESKTSLTTGTINHLIHLDQELGEKQRVHRSHLVDGELLKTLVVWITKLDGVRRLLIELKITISLVAGVKTMPMTTGETLEVTMKTDHHLQDLKGLKMTEEEVEVEVVVEEAEVMDLQTEEEAASNAVKKDIWLKTAQILTQDLMQAGEVVAETASNATKKAIWLENVQMLICNLKEVETGEETVEEVVEEAEAKEVGATNATKMVTLPKTARMNQIQMKEDHTRDKGEMMADP